MLTHNGFSTYVLANSGSPDGEEHGRALLAAPLYHVAGLTALTQSLFSGRRLVLLPQFEAGAWLRAVAEHRITHAFVVPSMMALLLRHPDFDRADLSSLEMLTYGAAPMPAAVLREAVERFPGNVGFSGAYGQTETNSTVAVLGPDDHRMTGTPEEIEAKRRRLSSVGKPLPDVEVKIADPLGEPLGPNEPGEVLLRTARAMAGYWRGGTDTTRVSMDDEGWVHTGDLGYLDDAGYLFLTGRASDLIIRGGENISPGEIEAVLDKHPDVQESACFGVPDDEWGERVFAAVVIKPGAKVTGEDLVNLCKKELAGSKRPEMVFVVSDFPRTATGKVLRRSMASNFVAAQSISGSE
jgi:acyl-CoA synthetase (AMP-forming)/AMP-acid ligase II